MSTLIIKQTLTAWSFRVIGWMGTLIPDRFTDGFFLFLGRSFGRLPLKKQRQMKENIRFLFGYSDEKATLLVRDIFGNFGLTLFHFFSPKGIQVEVLHREKLEKVKSEHNGFMILTFHIGHWELGARMLTDWGWPVTAVYQEYQSRTFQKLIESKRAPKVHFIPVGAGAARGVADALKRGDVVAMLGDHAFGEEGIPVQLLGQTILWPKGPALLALRENVPIVAALVYRHEGRHYRALVEDPIYPHGHTRAEIHRLVQEIADKFGRFLPDHLTQWYRFMPMERLNKEKNNS